VPLNPNKFPAQDLGYTLIEILIVLLIIGIITGIAVITINRSETKQMETLAQDINNLLSLASEEAMLRPATLGLAFTPTTYQFYVSQEDRNHRHIWDPIKKPPLNLHNFSGNIKITIKINGRELPLNGQPQIIINASGDISPFILLLGKNKGAPLYQVVETPDGSIKSEPVHET
jgi:general secretion pathway protein H